MVMNKGYAAHDYIVGTHPVVVNNFSDHSDMAGLGTRLEEDHCNETVRTLAGTWRIIEDGPRPTSTKRWKFDSVA